MPMPQTERARTLRRVHVLAVRGPRLGTALILTLITALVATGCGGGSTPSGATTAGSAVTTRPNDASATTSGSLAIEARVLTDGLAGLEPTGPPTVFTSPEDFAKNVQLSRDDVALLRQAGFVTAAVTEFGDGAFSSRSGLSSAVQFGSPDQARAEAARAAALLDSLQSADAERGSLPDVPGSKTTKDHGTAEGPNGTYATVVFTDGPFGYVVWGGGAKGTVDPQAVLDDASALYKRVKGVPAS